MARSLANDYEILFASSEKYSQYIEKEGFSQFPYQALDEKYIMQCASEFTFDWINEKNLTQQFDQQVALIKKYEPKLVLGDMSITLKMAAESTNVKFVSLVNSYMTSYYQPVRQISRKHPQFEFKKKVPVKVFDFITIFAEKFQHYKVHAAFKSIRKKYALQNKYFFLDEFEGDETWICDDMSLFPMTKIPSSFKIVGPLIYHSNEDESELLEALDKTKENILVTMGSTGNWQEVNFLNEEKFRKYNLIVLGDLENVLYQKWFIKRDFADLNTLLPHTKLLIFHGGNGTLYQGLKHKVKMLCFPVHFEQEWNVHQLEKMNLIDDSILR